MQPIRALTGYVAALPFLVEPFGSHLSPTYVVTKTNDDVPDASFAVGARVTTWNGIPFARAVDLYAETLTGGRPDARRARALETLTQRPLEYLPPPDELWVDIGYRLDTDDAGDADRTIRFEWRAIEPAKAITANNLIEMRTRRAINITSETARRARKLLFATALWERDQTDDHRPPKPTAGWPRASPTPSRHERSPPRTAHSDTYDCGPSTSNTPLVSSTRSPISCVRCPARA